MAPVTIDLPGKFDSFFSDTGVAQGATGDDPALAALHSAYMTAEVVKRGKGRSLRLTLPTDKTSALAVLEALVEYADACRVANADTVADSTADPADRAAARAEVVAAGLVIERAEAVGEMVDGLA